MQKLMVFLFALLSVAPAFAALDEAAKTIAACGKPKATITATDPKFGPMRSLRYPKARIVFSRSGGDPWHFSMATSENGGMLDAAALTRLMPCFSRVSGQAAQAEVSSVPSAGSDRFAGTENDGGNGVLVGGAVLAGLLLLLAFYREWQWRKRPMRLCTNCYTTAQPLQHKNKRWYCGNCGADNPVPMDSPLAREFYARQRSSNPQLPQ